MQEILHKRTKTAYWIAKGEQHPALGFDCINFAIYHPLFKYNGSFIATGPTHLSRAHQSNDGSVETTKFQAKKTVLEMRFALFAKRDCVVRPLFTVPENEIFAAYLHTSASPWLSSCKNTQ